MTESPNNNTVLQRLLAERRFVIKGYNNDLGSAANSKSSSRSDLVATAAVIEDVNPSNVIENDHLYQPKSEMPSERAQISQNSFSPPIQQDGGQAARLDALCRSTLDKPSSGFPKPGHLNTASAPNVKSEPKSVLKGSNPCSASREVLLRLKKELEISESAPRYPPTYQEAKAEAEQVKMSERSYSNPTNALLSPRYTSLELSKTKKTMVSRNFQLSDSDRSPKNPARPEFQLHGHPKSNSGGDEYFYTDHLKKSNPRRGIRSKKNKNGVGRSSSLRQTPEETVQDIRYSKAIGSTPNFVMDENSSGQLVKGSLTSVNPSQPKHASSRSAPLQDSEESNYVEQRRSSLHGILHRLTEDKTSDFSQDQSQSNQRRIDSTGTEMHQNHQDLSQVSTTNNQASYHRTSLPGSYGQGPFYGGVTAHSMIGQSPSVTSEPNGASHAPILNALAGNSPPRPPPPPYPLQYNEIDPSLTQNPDAEAPSWPPQRPNSLALGNCSTKKAINNSGRAQNSPCVTSPTSVKSFTPHVRGTPFYSNVKDSPYMTPNAQIYASTSNSPHQKQTSNGTSSYMRRSGSGNNITMTSSSSGSSTCTATTPAYQDTQFADPGLRSPVGTGRYPLQGFSQEFYGSGVSKSDSMNSASSSTTSGSGASRIGRRKRNSSKPGFGSGSSSSNSGSRPNSMADLADRLEAENENLRSCLDLTKQKLKRFENLQMELQAITQSHQALQQTASNRERLEMEMRNQLTGELEKTKAERDMLKDQVSSLTEQLKNMSMTSSNNDASDVMRVNNAAESNQAKTRKLVERERELEDELEEHKERISELNVDIELLTSSLHKAQTTITVLKEKFLQNDDVDAYTDQLSKSLAALQKIVDERQEIEKELKERIWRQLQSQQPLKSTSSNDEGISEMDPPDPATSMDVYSSREGQMLGAKAEMLKWQHRYLEHGLLKHVHSNGSEVNQHKRLYKALHNHRHAVSDPGFDKNPSMKVLLCGTDTCTSSIPLYENESINQSSSSLVTDSKSRIGSKERNKKEFDSAYMTADCASQTPTSGWIIGDEERHECEKDKENLLTKNSVNDTSASSGNVIDADSPSEGYHSQQSSGSPTPNTEKHSLHFTTSGDTIITNSHPREVHPGAFRRNRSADVLTSSNI